MPSSEVHPERASFFAPQSQCREEAHCPNPIYRKGPLLAYGGGAVSPTARMAVRVKHASKTDDGE